MNGFIEVTDAKYAKRRLINVSRIVEVCESSITVTTLYDGGAECGLRPDVIHCVETYEEIRQRIKWALGE